MASFRQNRKLAGMSSILSHSVGTRWEGLAFAEAKILVKVVLDISCCLLLHDGPVGDFDLLEFSSSTFGTSIRVFADLSQDEKFD